MPSQFFGLTIASSGLSAYQASLNTTANNISNVQMEGYTKQVANITASAALRVHTSYGTMGAGVTVNSITQIRNEYYDVKYWQNQSSLGLFETKLNYLKQIENYFIDDDTEKGFSTILNNMFNALDTLKNNAGDSNVRQQFIGASQNLATYFNSVATGLADIQNGINEEIKSTVANINSIGEKITLLNQQINVIEVQGGYANELRDQRAVLIDELSSIVDTEVSEVPVTNKNNPEMPTGANYYTVKINGQNFIDTYSYNALNCTARENKVNQSDQEGMYDVTWLDTGNSFNAGSSTATGSLKAMFDVRDGNNAENFTGTISGVAMGKITITNPSITSIAALTLPEEGQLTIDGRTYNYTDFTFTTDSDGNITSYTFSMDESISYSDLVKIRGKDAAVGKAIDSMGIPYYLAQMNEFLRSFSQEFNTIMNGGYSEDGTYTAAGEDLNGKLANYYSFLTGNQPVTGDEFVYENLRGTRTYTSSDSTYYQMTCANICVSDVCIDDPTTIATTADISQGVDSYELVEKMALLKSDTVLYRGGGADDFLQCMISDISVDTQESNIFYENYYNISNTIQNQRLSISGVDEDEEALDLVKFQNAYNLSSKMVSVLAEIYDKLIQETGV